MNGFRNRREGAKGKGARFKPVQAIRKRRGGGNSRVLGGCIAKDTNCTSILYVCIPGAATRVQCRETGMRDKKQKQEYRTCLPG